MPLLVNDANRSWWVLAAMTGSLSMILLDQTVVSVALPSIQRDLDLSQTDLQWVVNAYLLAIASLVAVGGRLADMFNRVNVFLLGVAVFVVASALCGLADDEAWLLIARGIQGVGAALMIPASAALVINAFPLKERGRAMGIYAGVSMIFLSLGPLVGGLLTEWTWRGVFWVNVPVGILTVLVTLVARPDGRVPTGQRLDLAGLFTLVPGLVAVVLALMQSNVWGWGDPLTWGLLAAGCCLLVLFLFLEPRVRQPLVELRLFRDRNFAGDNLALFCVQFGLIGLTVFGAIYVQDILGFSAIEAGLSLLALTLPLLVVAPRAGALYDRLGPRLLVGLGAALVAASLFWAGAVLDKLSYPWLVPGYIVMGVGIGLVMGPANTDAMNVAPRELRGQASGVVQTVRQVGGTIGLAIMGTLVVNVQHSKLEDFLSGLGASPAFVSKVENVLAQEPDQQQSAAQAIPAAERTEILDGVQAAVVSGISWAYYVGAVVMTVAAVVAFAVLRHERFEDAEEGHRHHGMRAVVHDRYGPPEVLRVAEVERPVPKEDEVLVRVRATTATRSDCGLRSAEYFVARFFTGIFRPKRGTIGIEFAGEVESVGDAVTELAVGDRVFGIGSGTNAEFVCMGETGVIARIPHGLAFEEAAAVADGGLSAISLLRSAGLQQGQRIVVYGASGSIGVGCVQVAKHLGAHVTAVCNTKNVDLVRSLGADEVIDYLKEDFTKNGETYDVVCDAVGKQSFLRCRGSLNAPRALHHDRSRVLVARRRRRVADEEGEARDRPLHEAGPPDPHGAARGRNVPPGDRPDLSARGHRRGAPLRRDAPEDRQRRPDGPVRARHSSVRPRMRLARRRR